MDLRFEVIHRVAFQAVDLGFEVIHRVAYQAVDLRFEVIHRVAYRLTSIFEIGFRFFEIRQERVSNVS